MRWMKIALSLTVVISLLVACTQSPTGRKQLIMFSSGEIASLGDQSYAELKQQQPLSTNTREVNYVRCVANDLLAELPEPWRSKTWEVNLFASDDVNAFALPGENIGVYTGLLKVAETPDQLAAVIGHEIAHVIADHGNERMSNQFAVGLGLQIGSVVAATKLEDKDAALVMAALGIGTQLGVLLPYSRVHESEADQLGLDYMAAAGYNPAAAADLWRNMARVSGAGGPEFLSTHPSPQSRIDAIEAYVPEVMGVYQSAPKANCKL